MAAKKVMYRLRGVLLLVLLVLQMIYGRGALAFAESSVPPELEGYVIQGDNGKTFAAGAPLASIIVDYQELDRPHAQDVELKILSKDPGFIATMTAPIAADQGNEIPYVVYDSTVSGARTIKKSQDNKFDGDLFSYTYKNAARLEDGTLLDVVITYSNMNIVLQNTLGISYDCQTCIALGDMLRTGNNLTGTDSHRYGLQIDVKMQAFDHDGNVVEGTALYAVTDIDVLRDNNSFKSLFEADKYHNYSEQVQVNGIRPDDGILASPIYIPDAKGKDDPMRTGYKCEIVKVGDNAVNFVGRGIRDDDPGTYYSGFAVLVNNSKGLSLTVRSSGGSMAGNTAVVVRTKLLSTTTNPPLHHRIVSTSTRGGTIEVPLGDGVSGYAPEGTKIMGPGTVTVMDGTTVTYTMTPEPGWEIFSVTVADEVTGTKNINFFDKNMLDGASYELKLAQNQSGDLFYDEGNYSFTFNTNNYDHKIDVVWAKKTSVTLKKVWEDNGNSDGKRPTNAVLELEPWVEVAGAQIILTENEMLKLGVEYPRKTISTSGGNIQEITWSNLPAMVPTGVEGLEEYWDLDIHYTANEPTLPDEYLLYVEGNQTDGYTMTNIHMAGVAELSAVKHILGRDWLPEDTFTFKLTPVDGAPLRTFDGTTHSSLEAVADADTLHHQAVFEPLRFVAADLRGATEQIFTYRIEEVVPADRRGLTYDSAKTVKIKVLNKKNVLTVTYLDDQNHEIHMFEPPAFYNHYEAKGRVSLTLPAEKILLDQNGDRMTNWGGASFVLELARADESSPLPSVVRQTVTADNPKVTFGEITFTSPGIYRYVIQEVLPSGMNPLHPADSKYLYETAAHEIVVKVEDDGRGGILAPKVDCDSAKEHTEAGVHAFHNQLIPEAWTVLEARKVMTGERLQEGAFVFALYKSDKDGSLGEEVMQVGNNSDGMVLFSPLVFYHDDLFAQYVNIDPDSGPVPDPGETDITLYYLMQELAHQSGDYSEKSGIVFDQTPILFEIVIHHSASHHLSIRSVRYKKGNGSWNAYGDSNLPVIQNASTVHNFIEIGVSKRISGRDWTKDDRFDFTITAMDGAPLNGQKVLRASANTGKRDIWFENIRVTPADLVDSRTGEYLKEKTFRYRIHEFADDGHGGDLNDGSGNAVSAWGRMGFVYAADVVVTVHVKELADGSLHVSYGPLDETTMSLPEFLNEWKDIPDPALLIPKTGDDSRMILWITLLLLGLTGAGILVIRRKAR